MHRSARERRDGRRSRWLELEPEVMGDKSNRLKVAQPGPVAKSMGDSKGGSWKTYKPMGKN